MLDRSRTSKAVIHFSSGSTATQAVHVPLNTLFEYIRVPCAESRLSTKNKFDRGLEELQRLCPLIRFFCVVFLGHLADLPWTPHLVAQGPVPDL